MTGCKETVTLLMALNSCTGWCPSPGFLPGKSGVFQAKWHSIRIPTSQLGQVLLYTHCSLEWKGVLPLSLRLGSRDQVNNDGVLTPS